MLIFLHAEYETQRGFQIHTDWKDLLANKNDSR